MNSTNINLTSPQEVIDHAFAHGEYVEPSAITPADAAAAEQRYILPVTGRELYECLAQGEYPSLREEYVVPAAAFFTRYMLQPLMDINTGRFGSTVPHSSSYAAADRQRAVDARAALREKARTLLKALSDHLDQNKADYPQYKPEENILHRCSTDGGLVQIL